MKLLQDDAMRDAVDERLRFHQDRALGESLQGQALRPTLKVLQRYFKGPLKVFERSFAGPFKVLYHTPKELPRPEPGGWLLSECMNPLRKSVCVCPSKNLFEELFDVIVVGAPRP